MNLNFINYLSNRNTIYKFTVYKKDNETIIKSNQYEIGLNCIELGLLTNIKFLTNEKAYIYILNLFHENKIKIKKISANKSIKLLIKESINNVIKQIELTLSYNKENKRSKINEENEMLYF